MAGFIWVLRTFLPLPWMGQAVIAGLFYLGVLLTLKTFNSTELEFAKHFVSLSNLKSAFFPQKGADA
jgi:hypothetical protein